MVLSTALREGKLAVVFGRLAYLDSSGYRSSFSGMLSSSRRGLSSSRYCSYWPLFSTLALMPVLMLLAMLCLLMSAGNLDEYFPHQKMMDSYPRRCEQRSGSR